MLLGFGYELQLSICVEVCSQFPKRSLVLKVVNGQNSSVLKGDKIFKVHGSGKIYVGTEGSSVGAISMTDRLLEW